MGCFPGRDDETFTEIKISIQLLTCVPEENM